MPPLTDPELLARLLEALKQWNCEGYIQWKGRPAEWLRENLPNLTQRAIGQLMYEHVSSGGEIDQIRENYEGYRESHPYHYDFRILVIDRMIYVETVFDEMKMGPTVTVVNIHDV